MDRRQRIAAALEKLFRTYPQFGQGDPEAMLRDRLGKAEVYFEALDSYEIGDIDGAVASFLSGSAPGCNPAYIPSAPMVAAETRRLMNLRLDSEARTRQMRPALPPPDIEKSPESRERVATKVGDMIEKLWADIRTEQAEADRRRASLAARTNDRFTPDQSSDAIKRRLMGWDVGDDAGDGDLGGAA